MNHQRILLWLERLFIGSLATILVLLPMHAFLSTWLGTAIGPLLVWKSWKEALLVLLVPALAYYCLRRPGIFRTLAGRRINQLVAAYAAIHLVVMLFTNVDSSATLAGLMFNLRFFAIFIVAQVVAESGNPWVATLKAYTPHWLIATMVGLCILAILQVSVLPADFLSHFGYAKDATISPSILVDENPNAVRAFATMRGPNTLGAYLLIPLSLAIVLIATKKGAQRRFYGVAIIAGVVGLALTGSRSAWIGAIAVVAALVFIVIPKSRLIAATKRFGLPTLLILIVAVWASITVPALRLAIFHSSPGDDSLFEGSTELHWQAFSSGATLALQKPFGMGPGSSGPATYYNHIGVNLPENYFVQIAQEVGLAGLILFLTICVFVARQLYQQRSHQWPRLLLASFIGLSVINVFLHGWADDPTAMTWWGLAGLYMFSRKVDSSTRPTTLL